jgi:hypothetical protein
MWEKEYRSIPNDSPLLKEPVEPGKGIIGCQMHEVAGWGDSYHLSQEKPRGLKAAFLSFFGSKNEVGQ